MTEQVLMNDEAARSPTGEILDQSSQTQTPASTTSQTPDQTSTTTTSGATGETSPTNTPPVVDPKAPPTPSAEVPATYAAFKAPDNYTIDTAALEADAIPLFKELGLTQDQAQKLIDAQIKRDIAMMKAPDEAVTRMRSEWRGKTNADAELLATVDKNSGKTGMDAVKINIAKTLAVLPVNLQVEFKDAMNLTGAGDHPAFVKAFNKLAAFVTEGSHVNGKNPSPEGQTKPGTSAKPDVASAMYPNLPRG